MEWLPPLKDTFFQAGFKEKGGTVRPEREGNRRLSSGEGGGKEKGPSVLENSLRGGLGKGGKGRNERMLESGHKRREKKALRFR